ncbi:asparaginase [Mesorhizobium sp. WSM2239]|uniref:Asparaginase n=2 Tax=unclassified Mesorhizobium TaxID=325217 RepID=A0AAU8D4D4_9HYPH
MTDPVLVEVLRGGLVESAHRGALAVFDADRKPIWEVGDTARPVFPRSAVKAIQALPLVESGAADAYGFGDRELALACASHSGEEAHIELARSILARAGLSEAALECGAHWPSQQAAMVALAREGKMPTGLHNNCSGKHAGFICVCCNAGIDHRGYIAAGHKLQEMVREAMEDVTGAAHGPGNRGTDGCSIPTYAVPLKNLAIGFAKMATGQGLSPGRAKAAKRLFAACMAEPFYVAGTGRADTALMQSAPGRIFVKIGAEGVYCAAVPELGLGIALKCDDGAGRAAEVAISAVLASLFARNEALSAKLTELANPALTNWNGIAVGSSRPTAVLNEVRH